MPPLTRRTQILLDDERYEAIRRRAESAGISVGAAIRKAIDEAIDTDLDERTSRARAGSEFLAAEPMDVGDWEQIESELEGAYLRDSDAQSPGNPPS